jgi:hypothetical protein
VKTPEEARLAERSTYLHLLDKLMDYSLSPKEWDEYQNLEPELSSIKREVEKAVEDQNPTPSAGIRAFETFYQEALRRDESMSSNLLDTLKNRKARVAVLVTGGFHSPGINDRLRRANVARITLAPKITKVDGKDGTAYLSVFTQEKTPLEKLFKGEKLFVTPLLFPASTVRWVAIRVVIAVKAVGAEANLLFHSLTGIAAKIIS